MKLHDRNARGISRTGWLDSKHTFSFGGFNDPTRMGVRSLRVINEDHVIPGAGFATHGHRDMEILTYVISGALSHKDSLGNGSTIRPGEIQRMSAGTGIQHSEMNASKTDPVHFLQIWVHPDRAGLDPSYEQVALTESVGETGFSLIAGPEGGEGAVTVHQDARLLLARPKEGESVEVETRAGRASFLQVVKGLVTLGDEELREGDGLEIDGLATHTLVASTDSELLLFDLGHKLINVLPGSVEL